MKPVYITTNLIMQYAEYERITRNMTKEERAPQIKISRSNMNSMVRRMKKDDIWGDCMVRLAVKKQEEKYFRQLKESDNEKERMKALKELDRINYIVTHQVRISRILLEREARKIEGDQISPEELACRLWTYYPEFKEPDDILLQIYELYEDGLDKIGIFYSNSSSFPVKTLDTIRVKRFCISNP